jgi:undecaprenyl-diphosphatase
VRIGLLLGVTAFFWRDVADMVEGLIKFAKGKRDPGARLAFQLITAALPSVALAAAIDQWWGTAWQTPMLTAWCVFVGGVLLLLFDRASMTVKRIEHAGYGDVLLIGLAQAAAIVPGVGRILASTAMARLLGYERADAARFSFLIWLPVLGGGCLWHGYHLAVAASAGVAFPTNAVLVGFGLAFVTTLVLLGMMMGWLRRHGFTPFALIRILLGANLLAFAYGVL